MVLSILVTCALATSILLSIEIGHRAGLRRWRSVPKEARSVSSAMEASILGLMGLLVAFVFYGAGSRFENRRSLVAQEANAIGTAYLRLDLLPVDAQPELREHFRKYVRSRLAVFRKIPNLDAVRAALDRSAVLQRHIWKTAVDAAQDVGPAEKSLVLSSINQMIDITTVRTVALATHPPVAVFVLLVVSVLVSSALAGYAVSVSGMRDWVVVLAYSIVVATAVYVIADFEFPRIGIVREEAVDQVLEETLKNMN